MKIILFIRFSVVTKNIVSSAKQPQLSVSQCVYLVLNRNFSMNSPNIASNYVVDEGGKCLVSNKHLRFPVSLKITSQLTF